MFMSGLLLRAKESMATKEIWKEGLNKQLTQLDYG
jgi:hypothetical protein